VPQGVEFGKISVLTALLLWGVKEKKPLWECCFWGNRASPESWVELEAQRARRGCVEANRDFQASEMPGSRSRLGDVPVTQGQGSRRPLVFGESFIHLSFLN
jgi:hypothetical protein